MELRLLLFQTLAVFMYLGGKFHFIDFLGEIANNMYCNRYSVSVNATHLTMLEKLMKKEARLSLLNRVVGVNGSRGREKATFGLDFHAEYFAMLCVWHLHTAPSLLSSVTKTCRGL